jgi:hypothetical protein
MPNRTKFILLVSEAPRRVHTVFFRLSMACDRRACAVCSGPEPPSNTSLPGRALPPQGIDWRDARAGACNANRNPVQPSFYDGISVDPLEVLFVKVKGSMRQAEWPHVLQVRRVAARPAKCR